VLDQDLEANLSQTTIKCPNFPYGCPEMIQLVEIRAHITECKYRLSYCSICSQPTNKPNAEKHPATCTICCDKCKKLYPSCSLIPHSTYCIPNKPNLKSAPAIDLEFLKENFRSPKIINENDTTLLYNQLREELHQCVIHAQELEGTFSRDIDLSKAEKLIEYYSKMDLNVLVKNPPVVHSLISTILMYLDLQTLFKQPTHNKIDVKDEADSEESLKDELEGLLLLLGVSKTATFEVKLKAVEAEYHRLKNLGDSNQAAEVQTLVEYMLKENKANHNTSSTKGYTPLQKLLTISEALISQALEVQIDNFLLL
jgi:hypothetical protein